MTQRYEVASVEEAIVLANRLKAEGTYDWFRGQTKEWPPHTTALRLKISRNTNALDRNKERISMFCKWLEVLEELRYLLNPASVHALFAILQHYGFATSYLDFTTDPAVAGFFASDLPQSGSTETGCIYCLKRSDLIDVWDTVRQVSARAKAELALLWQI
jgi:hypothetical protein